jgi:hypothetical protein
LSEKCDNVMDECNEFTDFLYGQGTFGIEKSIMPDFHKSFGKNMPQKHSDKLHGIECHDFPFFLFRVFVQKFNNVIFNTFDAIIGDDNLRTHILTDIAANFVPIPQPGCQSPIAASKLRDLFSGYHGFGEAVTY